MTGTKMLPSVALGLAGVYYLVAPHTLHVSSGLGFGLDHTYHIILGAVLIIGAAFLYTDMGKKVAKVQPRVKGKGKK